ncbi:ATP-binding cassette domain-containing protein [Clostridium senegalense]|uniref:ABC transporter ATP-binding protein n=1 Tax=Clostridium senegalense TaxID=1465809 RepID=A0A6M0H1Z1_9CLOT|nr:ABC transporter ATP-binding protein [Clostridium senegalense]NEU04113.1 ABC transporter ATP-binding protein [Clostridium senegalense]
MSKELIVINNVSKNFGRKKVLNNINLVIEKGQSIALLGHNGSGKSTFLKIICGLVRINSGEIRYSSHLKFNYIPEHFPKMNLTAKQYIKHMGLIEGIPVQVIEQKSEKLFKAFFMEEMLEIPMKHLSKGTLQKVGVIQAVLTNPDVILLDEPLSGQDIESQNVFIKLMNELKKEGVTIIMSCHERFLVRRISNVVYEIKNKGLEYVNLSETYTGEYDILSFLKSDKHKAITAEIENMVDKIENENNAFKIIVEREKSNEVIKKMIEDGYLLRGMYSE